MTDVILETHDIQGLVLRGYGPLVEARFLLLEVIDGQRARVYLQGLSSRINLARDSPETTALQVAFTRPGLERLGVPGRALETFSREFIEGMDDDVRATAMGDRGDNDPSTWQWGRQGEPIHVLLMIYAINDTTLQDQLKRERAAFEGGLRVVHEKETITLHDQKEHFGWKDGLSMPKIEGVPPERPRKKHQESWTTAIRPGEFVLGYRNDYNAYTESPTVELADDPLNHLPLDVGGVRKSLGRNGTYLVFREMTQDVIGFWDYLERQSREPGDDPVARAIALGNKMVGRLLNGVPLVPHPDSSHSPQATDNEFLFAKDPFGLQCPHGSHIRRANPRDMLSPHDRDHEASVSMVRKHQMIRRGRAFGRPVSKELDPKEILAARGKPDSERRGLHFICLVGDISRQFEFVQRAWIDSANFDSMFKDGDPISAARRPRGHANANDEFTCPAVPVRRKYKQLPQFTRLVGGAYFFMPGVAALRFISRHP